MMNPARATAAVRPYSPQSVGNRALVIDDDAQVRRATSRILKTLGFEVTAAANGSEGLSYAVESFDVLFVDLNMPIMNGAEFKRELDRRSVDVPVIVVSGERDVAEAASSMGAAAWIAKPCTANAIRQALTRLATVMDETPQRNPKGQCAGCVPHEP